MSITSPRPTGLETLSFEELIARVSGPQPDTNFGLSPRAARFARSQARRRQRLELIGEVEGFDLPEPRRGRFARFLDLLRNLDRPRNAFHNAALGAIANDPKDTFLQNFAHGWTFEETTHFEDFLDEFGAPAGWLRKVGGFAGDAVFDPLNLIPGGFIASKIGKAGAVQGFMQRLGQSETARKSFMRWMNVPGMDEAFLRSIDNMGYEAHDLMTQFTPIADRIKAISKRHREGALLPTALAEETDFARLREFVQVTRSRGASPDALAESLRSGRAFRNPTSIGKLISIRDPGLQDEILDVGEQFARFMRRTTDVREATGLVVPKLGEGLQAAVTTVNRRAVKVGSNLLRQSKTFRRQELTTLRRRRAEILKDIERGTTDPKVSQRLNRRLTAVEKRLKEEPFSEPDAVLRAFDEITTDMDSFNVAAVKAAILRDVNKRATAIQAYDQTLVTRIVEAARDNRRLTLLEGDLHTIDEAASRLPAWVLHLITPKAASELWPFIAQNKSAARSFANPRTASDIRRKFVELIPLSGVGGRMEVERALSFDEVYEAIQQAAKRRAGIEGAPLVLQGAKGIEKTVEELAEAGEQAGRGVLRKFKRLPTENERIAHIFQADPNVVAFAAAQRTVRSVASADYLREVVQFGKTAEEAGERLPLMFQLPDGVQQLAPWTKGIYFDGPIRTEIVRRFGMITNPDPILRGFDKLQNLWKSYTLFLFPWYFTRNAIGDGLNMMSQGFLNRPTDIMAAVKAMRIQWALSRNNLLGAKSTHVFLKNQGRVINGIEAAHLGLKNAVTNTGWLASVGNEAALSMNPLMTGVRQWLPGTSTFKPLQWGKNVGTFLENQRRLTMFIHRLEQGDDVRTAAAATKRALGDFRNEIMTPFERDFVGRGFPFSRWHRYNIPLQLRNLVHTGSRAKIMAILRGAEQLAPEDLDPADLPEYVPEWLHDAAGVPVRRDPTTGRLEFLILEGWHPSAELNNVLGAHAVARYAVDNLTPFIKAPIEFATGIDLYQGRKLLPSQEFLGTRMPGETVNILKNIRLLNEMDRFDPFGVFRVLRGRMTGRTAAIRALGTTVIDISPGAEQLRYDQERIEALSREISIARRIRQIEGIDEAETEEEGF